MKETLGQYLKRKRESHLISIQDISHATGISVHLIEAIEENDFHVISQPEKTAKYLRKYASYLNLDKKEVLSRYQAQRELTHQKKHLPPQLSVFPEGKTSLKQVRSEKRLFRNRFIRVIFLSAIFLLIIVTSYLYFNVMSSKTEAPDSREKLVSNEFRKNVSRERSDRRPVAASEKTGRSPDHSALAPARNVVPPVHDKRKKELNSQTQNTPQLSGDAKVVANRDSKLYHLPGMKYYHIVKSHHRVLFNSEAEAVRAGYRKARE